MIATDLAQESSVDTGVDQTVGKTLCLRMAANKTAQNFVCWYEATWAEKVCYDLKSPEATRPPEDSCTDTKLVQKVCSELQISAMSHHPEESCVITMSSLVEVTLNFEETEENWGDFQQKHLLVQIGSQISRSWSVVSVATGQTH